MSSYERLTKAELIDAIESLQATRREAEAASHSKDDFLAMISHELRTPLHAIQGWLHMLRLGRLTPEETLHALDVIDRNARHQVPMISSIFRGSRAARSRSTGRPSIFRASSRQRSKAWRCR